MSKKWKYGEAGSVSSGTMRPEDLLPVFCSELRYLGHRSRELSEIEKRVDKGGDEYFESEDSSYDLESLFDMLNSHARSYFYFGAHPGDGSDYGFWLPEDFECEFEGLKVSDLAEVPTGFTGEIIVTNDHGNMTLYFKNRLPIDHKNSLKEVWALV